MSEVIDRYDLVVSCWKDGRLEMREVGIVNQRKKGTKVKDVEEVWKEYWEDSEYKDDAVRDKGFEIEYLVLRIVRNWKKA